MKNRMPLIGLDVHDATIVAVWHALDEDYRKLTVPNSEDGIDRLAEAIGAEAWAVYETSGAGFVLYDQLTARRWKVNVLATTRIPKSVHSKKRKTDYEDAKQLLQILEAHAAVGTPLPSVWVPPVELREDREVARLRLTRGAEIGRVKTRIRAMLKIHGVQGPECNAWTKKYRAWLKGLCRVDGGLARPVWVSLASELRMLTALEEEVEELDAELALVQEKPAYGALAEKLIEIKGVGVLTAMVFLLELGDVRRFSNRKKLGSYLGLTPTSFESGAANDRKGHITHEGPWRIRKVLNQAALAYLRCNAKDKLWYSQLKYRRGGNRATVAMMRRLGIHMWHVACKAITPIVPQKPVSA